MYSVYNLCTMCIQLMCHVYNHVNNLCTVYITYVPCIPKHSGFVNRAHYNPTITIPYFVACSLLLTAVSLVFESFWSASPPVPWNTCPYWDSYAFEYLLAMKIVSCHVIVVSSQQSLDLKVNCSYACTI